LGPVYKGSQPAGFFELFDRWYAAIAFHQACGYPSSQRMSPLIGQYQPVSSKLYCLVAEAHALVISGFPKAVTGSGLADIRTVTFWVTSERSAVMPHRYIDKWHHI